MIKEEKLKLLEKRKQEIIKQYGLDCDKQIIEVLLNDLFQEFFLGEISRDELEEYASLMGYELNLTFIDYKTKETERELC